MSDPDDGGPVREEPTPLQRVRDLLVFAPVGVALTVVEDLPGLIGKGRQRFESDVQNARVIGKFVVAHGQHEVVDRVGKLLRRGSAHSVPSLGDDAMPVNDPAPPGSSASASPPSSPKPEADPADGLIVEGALAGYDTLSASQVVRRLESLGPDELGAIHRHEASHRNRRTILNRAHQILEAKATAGEAPVATARPPAEVPEPDRPGQ